MSSAEQPHEEEHHDEVASSYVPPPPKSIGELVAADQEDESLRKYKETLLGNAIAENIVIGFYEISCFNNFLVLKWFPFTKLKNQEILKRFW